MEVPKHIKYNQISTLLTRRDFIDPDTYNAVSDVVQAKENIAFLPSANEDKNEFIRGAQIYHIYMYGVTPDGSNAVVILEDVPVIVDVKVQPSTNTPTGFLEQLKEELFKKNLSATKFQTISAYEFKGFQTEKSNWIRVYFQNLKQRKLAVEHFIERGYATANDDIGFTDYYFNVVARMFRFNTAKWNKLPKNKYVATKKYILDNGYEVLNSNHKAPNCEYLFRISVKDIEPLEESQNNIREWMIKDKTMTMAWDIETYSHGEQTGEVPTTNDTNFDIFNIGISFQWQYSATPLVRYCIISGKTTPFDDVPEIVRPKHFNDCIIECSAECEVLDSFCKVIALMNPNIILAFNGSSFDVPLTIEKLRRLRKLTDLKKALSFTGLDSYWDRDEATVAKNIVKSSNVKIDAQEMLVVKHMVAPGIIDTDVMIIFKQLFDRAEVGRVGSLNFYLKQCKLDGKEDMDYRRMFKIYEMSFRSRNKKCHCAVMAKCDNCTAVHKYFNNESNKNEEHKNEANKNEANKNEDTKCCVCNSDTIAKEMALVGYYCVIDAYRCQQLFIAKSVVSDKRELSNMSYVNLYDSFYKANGMKVRNLIAARCDENDILFSNAKVNNEKIKYPGAVVFEPIKGLENKRPVAALDASSLYPSVMRAFNLSPDKLIRTKNEVVKLRSLGYTLHKVKFTCENGLNVKGWTVRHNGVHEVHPKPGTKIIDHFDKNTDGTLKKKMVPVKNNDGDVVGERKTEDLVPVYGRECLPGESMGIMPFILNWLFGLRVIVKKELTPITNLREKMNAIIKDGKDPKVELPIKMITDAGFTLDTLDIAEVDFRFNKLDSKQKAMKVHMNTFYGEAGNYLSPIFELIVSGGTTAGGRYTITRVYNHLKELGYTVKYGDTDSNYIVAPESRYADVDKQYNDQLIALSALENVERTEPEESDTLLNKLNSIYQKYQPNIAKDPKKIVSAFDDAITIYSQSKNQTNIIEKFKLLVKEEYWTKMVQIMRDDIENLRIYINDYLAEDNNTEFIKMAYEEVLFPVIFTGKKKYTGFQHMKFENFHPTDGQLFVKGIDIIKQGQTGLAKKYGYHIIQTACSLSNTKDLKTIVLEQLDDIFGNTIDISKFILTGKYRPNKANVPIQTFIARMKQRREELLAEENAQMAALYELPEPGERFTYVVVKKYEAFDHRGKKIDIKKGDKMEFYRVYEASQKTEFPLEIDLNYYIGSSIIGLFARFISYIEEFHDPAITLYDDQDKHVTNMATNYLQKYVDNIQGINKDLIRKQASAYRSTYNHVSKGLPDKMYSKYGASVKMIYDIEFGNNQRNMEILRERANSEATEVTNSEDTRKFLKKSIKEIESKNIDIYKLRRLYLSPKDPISILKEHTAYIDSQIKIVNNKLGSSMGKFLQFLQLYNKSMDDMLSDNKKQVFGRDDPKNIEDRILLLDKITTLNTEDEDLLKQFYELYSTLVGLYITKKEKELFYSAIIAEINKRSKIICRPTTLNPK
jgi:DNA polymerase elongation subunit (family B)